MEWILPGPDVSVGRLENNHVCMPQGTVSGHHARIVQQGNQFQVIDNGSTNGCKVNGERISSAWINHGDLVAFGQVQTRFVAPGMEVDFPMGGVTDPNAASVDWSGYEGGRSKLPIILVLVLLLAGGGFATWFFVLRPNPDNLAEQALAMLDSGEYEQAEDFAKQAVEADPEHAKGNEYLLEAREEQKNGERIEEAREAFEEENYDRAMELLGDEAFDESRHDDERKELLAKVQQAKLALRLDEVSRYVKQRKTVTAKRLLDGILDEHPDNETAAEMRKNLFNRRWWAQYWKENP